MSIDVLTSHMIARAHEGRASFERAEQPDHREYLRVRHGSPQWVRDVVRAAHRDGEILPDDWRYDFTFDALGVLVSSEEGATQAEVAATVESDVITLALVRWLGSNTARLAYCDQVLEEAGAPDSTSALLSAGQTLERVEVLTAVWDELARL